MKEKQLNLQQFDFPKAFSLIFLKCVHMFVLFLSYCFNVIFFLWFVNIHDIAFFIAFDIDIDYITI